MSGIVASTLICVGYIFMTTHQWKVRFLFRRQIKSAPKIKSPLAKLRGFYPCAHLGSNQGPKDYESSTLTN